MSFPDLGQIITEGVIYDLIKTMAGSLVVTIGLTYLFKRISNKLSERKEVLKFAGAAFVTVCAFLYLVDTKTQEPNFVGSIQTAVVGTSPADGQSTILVIAMSVDNIGTMQSIAKNWAVHASLNGVDYAGVFATMPPTFTFNNPPTTDSNFPTSITYKAEDDIVGKTMLPIQPGAMVAGTVFVVFQHVDPTIFKAGADVTVTYEDVLSKKYAATVKFTGQMSPVGILPGLHSVMACPIPNGQLPFPKPN